MDFLFKTDITKLIYIPFLVVSVLISFYLYRKSILTGYAKFLLPAVRALTIFLLFVLFTSPVLSFLRTINEQPRNVILIDNSESLVIENRYKNSIERLNEINSASTSGNKNEYFFFSAALKNRIGSIPSDSSEFFTDDIFSTGIGDALTDVLNSPGAENIASVHIVTDGINNRGGNPSYFLSGFDIPVLYHLIGDTVQKRDLSIIEILYNKRTFVESKTPVKIRFDSYDYDGIVSVKLFDGNNLIDEKFITVNSRQTQYETEFSILSLHPGFKKFRIEMSEIPGEITYINNFESFFIKFIDNKFRVLVIAGSPSSDLAFLRQEMKRISNFESTFLTQKGRGTFYESEFPDINRYQSILFIGYPNKFTDERFLSDIVNSVKRYHQSVFFFASRDIDFGKLQVLEEVLPFISSGGSENEFETTLRSVGTGSGVFRNSDFLNSINSLPQIFTTTTLFAPKPGSETFVINNRTQSPALIINTAGTSGQAAFLGHGFYNWRLTPSDHTPGERVLSEMLGNVVLAITDKEKQKNILVETIRPVYSSGENFTVRASVNQAGLETRGNVTLKVISENFSQETSMISSGPNLFETNLSLNDRGDYILIAELRSATGLIDSDTAMIEIGININEFRETRATKNYLDNIAQSTGGKEITRADNISEYLSRKIDSRKTFVSNIQLNFSFTMLWIIILLWCIEWFLRKRNNLP